MKTSVSDFLKLQCFWLKLSLTCALYKVLNHFLNLKEWLCRLINKSCRQMNLSCRLATNQFMSSTDWYIWFTFARFVWSIIMHPNFWHLFIVADYWLIKRLRVDRCQSLIWTQSSQFTILDTYFVFSDSVIIESCFGFHFLLTNKQTHHSVLLCLARFSCYTCSRTPPLF